MTDEGHGTFSNNQVQMLLVSMNTAYTSGMLGRSDELMGLYNDFLLPKLIDLVMSQEEFVNLRRSVLSGLKGTVLEIGIGSGLSLPYYPGSVQKILAVEPSITARKMAMRRAKNLDKTVEFVGASAENIPLPDQSVDFVVSTWTLCTIPDLPRALSEIHRILKPTGEFHFVEHGKVPEPKAARWQDRLTPIQKAIGGGCHLNRKIDEAILDAGFRITDLQNFFIKGPKILTYQYLGKATR